MSHAFVEGGLWGSAAPPWESWNCDLFLRLHATAASPHWLITLAAWLTEAPLFVALGLTALQLLRRRDLGGGIRVALAFAIALLAETLVSALAFHPRPFAAGLGPAWVEHAANNSMPSTHVALTLIMALVLILRRQRGSGLVLLGLGVVLAWARIYVGIHWPADMIGAAISACVSVMIAEGFARLGERFLPNHRQKPAASPKVVKRRASLASQLSDMTQDR